MYLFFYRHPTLCFAETVWKDPPFFREPLLGPPVYHVVGCLQELDIT